MDVCCLSPQDELDVTPLIWGCRCSSPCTLPGQQGQCLAPACRSHSGCPSLPLEPTTAVIIAPTPRASVRWCPVAWEHLQGESCHGNCPPHLCVPLVMASCLSGRCWLLLSTPSVTTVHPLQAVSAQPTLIFSLDLNVEAWASAPSPLLCQRRSALGCGAQGSDADLPCRVLSILPSANQLLRSPPRLECPSPPRLIPWCRLSPGPGNLSSFIAPSLGCRPVLTPFLLLFLCPTWSRGGSLVLLDVRGLQLAFTRCSEQIVPLTDVLIFL